MKNLGTTTVAENRKPKESSVRLRFLTDREMVASGGALRSYAGKFFGDKVEENAFMKFREIFQGEEYGLFQSYNLYDFGLFQLRSCCIHLKVTMKDPKLPPSLDGKYRQYRQIWFHENGKWQIWYKPNKGWIIGQFEKNIEVIFGRWSIDVQCPHTIEKWYDGIEYVHVHVQKISDLREKDLIAINKTRRCVFMVSCKRSLSSNAIEDSIDELSDGWERFKNWFSSSNENKWKFIPLIYYENGSNPAENSSVENFIIKGI